MIQAMLQAHTDPSVGTVRYSNRQKPFIFEKTVDSYWFLTDEGIEYVDLELEKQVQALTSPISSEPDLKTYIDSVTFHQSFSYEEFIEGIKPLSDEDGNITYPVVDGVFKKFCKQAEADPDRTYLFIIDEINRANIAKVFGELITIIEDDKRGTEVKLPYSQELFSVPKNLYIIGTMNTADRSIALLDIALRRRFAFVEVLPDPELVKTVAGIDLRKLLTALNQTITATLGRDYQIGHSYFLGLEDQQALEFAWYYRVIPLLQEYYYSDRESLQKILGKFIVSENNGVESNHRSPSAYRIEQLTGEDFRKAIEAISNDRPR
jgi:5-methylcytosine-specific restriction protein B